MKIDAGKWFVEFTFGWRIVCFNWHWPRWEFGYTRDWCDGPHCAFVI